jgi:peptidoglycan/xylan/chitin deacetylase (PgdA/CDA1 family)
LGVTWRLGDADLNSPATAMASEQESTRAEGMKMRYAGVSWTFNGYETAVLGDAGEPLLRARRFPAGRINELIAVLRDYNAHGPDGLACVVDSSNGLLEGFLLGSDLTFYRADPEILPGRPPLPAVVLAHVARRDLSRLERLHPRTGAIAGRDPELTEGWEQSEATELHGYRSGNQVALTFDDGPDPLHTLALLEILDRYDALATFFCIGMQAMAYPQLVGEIAAHGHAIGNHTWSHPFLLDLGTHEFSEQLDRTNEAIDAATGRTPTFFRPPYGARTPEIIQQVTASGMAFTLWDVDPRDWSMPGADRIAEAVREQARHGSIILLHDGGGDRSQTVSALPRMLDNLLDCGYRLTTMDQLSGFGSHASPGSRR